MASNKFELVDTLGFKYIRDHSFEGTKLKAEMKKQYNKVVEKSKKKPESHRKEFFMDKMIEDDGDNLKIIATKKGFGLAAGKDFAETDEITTYLGEITKKGFQDKNSEYVMQIRGTEFCVDSKKKGNLARFINHSCDPNCHFVTKWYKDKCYPVLVAARPIDVNDELTYDYQYTIEDATQNFFCCCGEKKCRRVIARVEPEPNVCGLSYEVIDGCLELTNEACTEKFGNATEVYHHRFSVHCADEHMTCKLCPGRPEEKKVYETINALLSHYSRTHKQKRTEGNHWELMDERIPCKYCKKWAPLSPTKWQDHLVLCDVAPGKHCEPAIAWTAVDPRILPSKDEKADKKEKEPQKNGGVKGAPEADNKKEKKAEGRKEKKAEAKEEKKAKAKADSGKGKGKKEKKAEEKKAEAKEEKKAEANADSGKGKKGKKAEAKEEKKAEAKTDSGKGKKEKKAEAKDDSEMKVKDRAIGAEKEKDEEADGEETCDEEGKEEVEEEEDKSNEDYDMKDDDWVQGAEEENDDSLETGDKDENFNWEEMDVDKDPGNGQLSKFKAAQEQENIDAQIFEDERNANQLGMEFVALDYGKFFANPR